MPDAPPMQAVDDSLDGAYQAYELSLSLGWGDGLPIIAPSRDRVQQMLAAVEAKGDEVVAQLPPARGKATMEVLAAAAVMAGCLPEYFAVVVAAVKAAEDPTFSLGTINATTNPVAPLLIVNGPIRRETEMNCSYGLLGPGTRANATIGRAFSLVMINVAGRRPGEVSKSVHGQPARYSFCIGENEEESPWEPFHVEHGFQAADSVLSLLAPTGTTNVLDVYSISSEGLLRTIASTMKPLGNTNLYPYFGLGQLLLLLGPEHALLFAKDGLSKQDVKRELFERTSDIPFSSWSDEVQAVFRKTGLFTGSTTAVMKSPEQLEIVVAGGSAGGHSVYMPTFGDSWLITQKIEGASAAEPASEQTP